MLITRRSKFTGAINTMDLPINEAAFENWRAGHGPSLERLFPHLTADQREFLISGTTKEEWARLFPAEEEEED
jgi:hypothetical protein